MTAPETAAVRQRNPAPPVPLTVARLVPTGAGVGAVGVGVAGGFGVAEPLESTI
ncbi:MAG: hypothetical protein H0T93_11315 [Chloroflexia bacterium]|nr:hypothetical protein [Chloroflexia bacterium]